jgi:hypothetical protein
VLNVLLAGIVSASPSYIRASAMPSPSVSGVSAKSDQAIGFVGGIVKLTRFEASGFTN